MSDCIQVRVKNLIKKEVRSMKKLLGVLLVLSMVSGFVGTVLAATSDIGYVVVRCTGTLSVMVGNAVDQADGGDEVNLWALTTSSPNAVVVSTAIAVSNNGVGLISSWSLQVTGQEQGSDGVTWAATDTAYPAWAYNGLNTGDCGVNAIALKAVFCSAQATQADFDTNDLLDDTGRFYQTAALQYGPATNSIATAVTSAADKNMVSPGQSRNLYFKVRLPSGVSDQRYRKVAVTVTAGEGL